MTESIPGYEVRVCTCAYKADGKRVYLHTSYMTAESLQQHWDDIEAAKRMIMRWDETER